MKRGIIIVAYWLAAIIFTACILMSLDYDIGHAVIMSLTFLPAAMALSYFLPKVEKTQEKKERVLGAVLALLAYGHFHLLKWLDKKYPTDGPITFYSVYKKISLKREDILYIESRDSEVWIYAQDGQQYRNRTGISQWEDVLGSGFVRIHRSYLVNRTYASVSSPECVCVAGKELPVSRKYKDEVFRMKKSIIASFVILLLFCSCHNNKASLTQQSGVTAEMAYEGVSNYCHSEYDWSPAESNPSIMSLEMGEETDSEYQVVFRSYTGSFVYFYVQKSTGSTRMEEYVPVLDIRSEAGTINLFDYLEK